MVGSYYMDEDKRGFIIMSTLYMIRHGQASFGSDNYDMLSDMGNEQSRVLAEHLIKLGINFNSIFTGEMERHKGTMMQMIPFYNSKNMALPENSIMADFNEYDSMGVVAEIFPEMLEEDPSYKEDMERMVGDKKSFQRVFEQAMYRWVDGNYKSRKVAIWNDFVARVYGGLDKIMNTYGKGKNIAVFTSGGPISVSVKRALNLSDRDTMRISWQIVNASVTRFKFTHDRIMLSVFNDHTHLEIHSGEELITYR